MSPKKTSTNRCERIAAGRTLHRSDLMQAGFSKAADGYAMAYLKKSSGGTSEMIHRGVWVVLLWMAWTLAQAGGVVVDATRTFSVSKTLSDLQDPPLTVSATITNSPIKILTEVKVGLHLVGSPLGRGFASEIYVALNKDLEVSSILLNQVGVRDDDPVGFGYDGWEVTFSDSAESDVHLHDIGSGVLTGEIQPDGRLRPEDIQRPALLSAMLGRTGNGDWHLSLADLEFGGTMRLESWSLILAGLTNRPPYFVGLTNETIPEMKMYERVLSAVDPDMASQAVTYALVAGPEGAEVVNGVFRWNPTEVQGPSTNLIQIAVSDGQDASTNSFTLIVTEVNRSPSLAGASELTIPEAALYTLALSGVDPDIPGQPLSLRLIEGPDGSELEDGVFRWTPLEEQGPSTHLVWVEVSDGIDTVTNAFRVVVREVNQPPVMTKPVSEDVDELSTYEQRFSATDDDLPAQEISFRLVSGPEGSVISDGIFSWTPSETMGPSVQTVLVAADDGLGSVTNSFILRVNEVNRAPSFSGLTSASIPKLTRYSQRLVGKDPDLPVQPLSFWMVFGPPGASVTNGVFTWTPSATQGDQTYRVVVAVSDGLLSVTNSFSLMVGGENSPPRFTGLSNEEAPELAEFSKTLSVADTDTPAQPLTVALIEGPAGAEVTDGRFVWFPTEAQGPSSHRIVVAVSDGFAWVTNDFVLNIIEVNKAPALAEVGTQTVLEGVKLVVDLVATDADIPANTLRYRLVQGPTGLQLNPITGRVEWTPTNTQGPATYDVTVEVNDNGQPALTASRTFKVVVIDSNRAPVASNQEIQGTEEVNLPITLQANDPDGDTLTYAVVVPPQLGVLTGNAPNLTYIPHINATGRDQFTFKVNDGKLDSGLATVTVNIAAVNDPPVIAAISKQVLDAGAPLVQTLYAVDVDVPVQELTFSLKSGPSGMTLKSGNTLVWLPKGSQRPSTNRVVVGVTDGMASVETSFDVVAKAAEQVTLFSGVAIDGYISGARVWFDANLNGIQDPEEPTTTTDRTGGFRLDFDSSRFDRNSNGALESSEGRLVVEGGVDLSSGQPRVGQLVAPPGSTVVTPLTTLVDLVSRQVSGLSTAAAEEQVRKTLGLPTGVSLTQFNPIDAAVKGDPSAAAVQVASAAVADTIALIASVIDQAAPALSATQASALVSQALAEKIASSTQVDLKSSSLLAQTITAAASAASTVLSVQVTEAVSQVVAEQNAAKQTLVEKAGSPLEALQAISQVQAVVQGQMISSLGELGSGKTSADEVKLLYTGAALVESVAAAPVGDVTGTNLRPGLFEFSSTTAVGVEDGRTVQPLTVLRKGGAYGKVQVVVRLSGDSTLLKTNVVVLDFEDGTTQQALDFKSLFRDDSLSQVDRTIAATISLEGTPPSGAGLGGLTQSSIRVLDNDAAGSIGFVSAQYKGLEGDPVLVELERINGTAGVIVGEIRLSGGTASLGSDYRSVQVPITFASGQTRASINLGWLDDGVYELMESVNLSLTLGSGSASGASLISGKTTAVLEVSEKPSVNRTPALAGVDDVRAPWGTAVVLLLQGTDPDVPKDHLTYSMVSGPEALKIDPVTGLLEWTPESTDVGKDFDITVRVTDSGFPPLEAEQVFRITVTAKPVGNRPPVVATVPDQTLKPGVAWSLRLVATDPDLPANVLTYRLVSGPTGLQVNSQTGVLDWKPTEAVAGNTYEVLVEVTDNGKPALSSRQSLKLRVSEVEVAPLLEIGGFGVSSELELKVSGTRGTTQRILSSYDLKTWKPYGEIQMTSSVMSFSVPLEGTGQFFRLSVN